jgi:acyl transferase domain-containing protein
MEPKAIAITGMSCIFPGAYDLDSYWKNILAGRSAIGPVPKERLLADIFAGTEYAEAPYCTRGGFLDTRIPFAPLEHGIMPSICENGDPEQLLTLQVADRALRDSGIDPLKTDLTHTEIIIGRGGYLGSFLRQGYQYIDVLPQVMGVLRQLLPDVSNGKLAKIRGELKSCFAHLNSDSAPLAVPNINTGRIANRFNMMGANYTVDAACASALIAAENALLALRQERCARVITGGIFLASNPSFWWLFARLEALSASGAIKPFSKFADGMLAGEGLGLLVFEPLEEALKAGRRVYAVIKGIGTASDGKGATLLAPRKEGQVQCLRRAYQDAGIDPGTIDLLEGHGTATKVGDHTELEAINEFFGPGTDGIPTRALGSVKSMIGHTMPASGAASLIKMALSVYHKILPPTLCNDAGADGLIGSSFYLNTTTRPWVHPPTARRRAALNAFGFGGINGHVVLEEHDPFGQDVDDLPMDWPVELFLVSADTFDELLAALQALLDRQAEYRAQHRLFGLLSRDVCTTGAKFLNYRLAITAENYDALSERLGQALTLLKASQGRSAIQSDGIFFENEPLKKSGKIVFVFPGNAFPGLGDDYTQRLSELCLYLPFFRAYFDMLDHGKKLSDKSYRYSTILFSPPSIEHEKFIQLKKELRVLDNSASGVFMANAAGHDLMTRLGIVPDMLTGTSLGEWSAVVAAGMVDAEELASLEANAQGQEVDEIKGAIGLSQCPLETLQPFMDEFNREQVAVTCSMDLSPKQVIFAGTREGIDGFCKILNDAGIWAKYLNLFPIHSPVCQPIADLIHRRLEGLRVSPAKIPAYSASTTEPFPEDAEQMRSLLADNAVMPVRMRALFEKLYAQGARIFVQLGGGGKIATPLHETLEGKPFCMLSLDVSNRHPIDQLQQLIAGLYAHHAEVRVDLLFQHRNRYLNRSVKEKTKRSDFTVQLKMSLPSFEIKDPSLQIHEAREPQAAPPPTPEAAQPALSQPVQAAAQPELSRPAQAAAQPEPPRPALAAAQAPVSPWEEIVAEQLNTMTRIYAMQKADEMNDMSHFMNMLDCQARLILADSGQAPAPVSAPRPVARPVARPIEPLPFVGEIVTHTARQKIVFRRKLNLNADLFLKDHAFIPCPNDIKSPAEKLPTMPMAVALEIISEAAQTLFPDKVVCGLKQISNKRWIGLSEQRPEKELVVTAQVAGTQAGGQIAVDCSIATQDAAADPGFTGTVLLADDFWRPTEPLPMPAAPGATRSFAPIDPKQLYRPGGLYHGPCFQGLEKVLKTSEAGVEALLTVPSAEGFFAGGSARSMILPAQTIDAASQIICCYDLAMQTRNHWVAPVSIDQIRVHRPAPAPGTPVRAELIIRQNDSNLVRFDLVLASGDQVFMVVLGWRDWRMKWSKRLLATWQNPSQCLLASKKEGSVAIASEYYALYGMDPKELAGIDPDWVARLYLNALEYESWHQLPSPQQVERLTEYIAIKDAARELLQQKKIFVYPSQITARSDGSGQFTVRTNDKKTRDMTLLSVLTAKRDRETVAMAAPLPIEDFSEFKLDLLR